MRATSQEYKEVNRLFNEVSFRKFGNAFRKHIDETFKAEYNLKSLGGQVSADFTWKEYASYIIGDESYYMTKEQFSNFMSEFKQ